MMWAVEHKKIVWHFEKIDGPDDVEEVCGIHTEPSPSDTVCGAKATHAFEVGLNEPYFCCDLHKEPFLLLPLPKKPLLRARAFPSDDTKEPTILSSITEDRTDEKMLICIDAKSPQALVTAIVRSGLLAHLTRDALEIGIEIQRVWSTR